jgi:hypothetical protein
MKRLSLITAIVLLAFASTASTARAQGPFVRWQVNHDARIEARYDARLARVAAIGGLPPYRPTVRYTPAPRIVDPRTGAVWITTTDVGIYSYPVQHRIPGYWYTPTARPYR